MPICIFSAKILKKKKKIGVLSASLLLKPTELSYVETDFHKIFITWFSCLIALDSDIFTRKCAFSFALDLGEDCLTLNIWIDRSEQTV